MKFWDLAMKDFDRALELCGDSEEHRGVITAARQEADSQKQASAKPRRAKKRW